MNVSAISNTPTIPIKPVTKRKFTPLIVSCFNNDAKTQLKLYDDQRVQAFIQEALSQFDSIKDKSSSLYAIRLKSTHQYINEKNRADLLTVNEQIRFHEVEICFNLETEVKTFVDKIVSLKVSNVDALIESLASMERFLAADRLFAFEFYAKGGKKILIDMIKECDRLAETKKWGLMLKLFKILAILIKNWSIISWDKSEIDLSILKLLCDTLNDASKENKKHLFSDSLLLLFLDIANDILNNSQHTRDLMLKELKFNDIIFIIQRQNIEVKDALLVFINSCFAKCDHSFIKLLHGILSQPLMMIMLREQVKSLLNLAESTLSIDDKEKQNKQHSFPLGNKQLTRDSSSSSSSLSSLSSTSSTTVLPTLHYFERNNFKTKLRTSNNQLSNFFRSNRKLFNKSAQQQHVDMKSKQLQIIETEEEVNEDDFWALNDESENNNVSKDEKNVDCVFRNLAILQKNILDIDLTQRFLVKVDQTHMNKIKSICSHAFESNSDLSDEEKYSRLGFSNIQNPLEDLKLTQSALFALDFMEFFSNKQTLRSIFLSFVSEKASKTSEYSFPFAKACIHMVNYFCAFLKLTQTDEREIPKEKEILFIMFTMNSDGIFEFFAKCLWLFQRLWVEMKAQSLDFDRALCALKDSLTKIICDLYKLGEENEASQGFLVKRKLNEFNVLLETWKYDFIKNMKTKYDKSNLEPLKELERLFIDEVIDEIRPKRLHVLCKGERFDKINQKEKKLKQKQIWKLSPDFKTFHCTDCDMNNKEIANDQIEVVRIKEVRKEDSKKQIFLLNIVCKRLDESGEQSILLAHKNEEIIDAWMDGITMLINPRPTTNIACLVECLIDTQLLDLNTLNYEIPAQIPSVPPLPADFDFNIKPNST